MKKTLLEYLERGGTKTAIAECWGVSRSHVSAITKENPASFIVDYAVMNPRRVNKFIQKEIIVKKPARVLFDKTEGKS
jgi:hypothetical protein